jgi:hypothetical protein
MNRQTSPASSNFPSLAPALPLGAIQSSPQVASSSGRAGAFTLRTLMKEETQRAKQAATYGMGNMKNMIVIGIAMALLAFVSLSAEAQQPGDLYFRTNAGEYIKINDDGYAEIAKTVNDATRFGRMQSSEQTYYVANSGKWQAKYLSYKATGYVAMYTQWSEARPWIQDKASLCLTIDNGSSWKTYEYAKDNINYIVIGDYDYTQKCFLPVPATEAYQSIKLQSKYVNENASCTWQLATQCAPYVTYLTDSQSATFALNVVGGKLYQGNSLFDTTGADRSHSLAHTSIYVMDLRGVIYASKQNKVYMFHHSSLLAGRDVAFAGEMQVEQGVIKKITNCSGHYLPNIALAKQLIDSLSKQGYTNPPPVDSCSAVFFDLDYNDLTPKR